MAEIIVVQNFPDINLVEQTFLTSDEALSGSAVDLNVENSDGFSTDNAVLIGNPGSEGAEIKNVSSVSAGIIRVASLTLNHKKGEPVYLLRGLKARIYRADAVANNQPPAIGDFSVLATVTLQADQVQTEYNDSSGSVDYWYLYTFYNDIPGTPLETAKLIINAVRGGNYNMYTTVPGVKAEAGFNKNRYVDDATVALYMRSAQDIVNSYLATQYSLPLEEVPAMVELVTRLYAAGLLLKKEFGPTAQGTNKEGQQKIDLATSLLEKISSGALLLIGLDGTQLPLAATSGISGFPMEDDDQEPGFTRDQVF